MFLTIPLVFALATGSFATPTNSPFYQVPGSISSSIQWSECDPQLVKLGAVHGVTTQFFCANLVVPLDYTDLKSNKTHILELIQIPAKRDVDSRGSIIFNFGGPGDAGIETMVISAGAFLNATSGEYDLVSFSPRGTSKSHLQASCFDTPEERNSAIIANPLWELVGDSTRAAAGWRHAHASVKAFNSLCEKNLKHKGEYFGTAFTARDTMAIVDALGEEKLNYWGISYGTVLGLTLAGMYPDRMGRIVLDSVVNPYDYYESYLGPSNYEDLDKTLKASLQACIESGPEGCALAEESPSADELEKKVHMLFKSLSENPLVWPAEFIDYKMLTSGFYLDGSTLRDMMVPALYAPGAYHFLMTALAGLLKGDILPALGLRSLGAGSNGSTITEALSSIYCSDRRSPKDASIEAAQAAAIVQREQSPLVGGFLQMLINPMGCANWPFTAKEIYGGDFKLDTHKNPFLVLGNTYDPVTPLSSARNVANDLNGSVLVEVNGFGHGAMGVPSKCLSQITSQYFHNGDLPNDGTVCQTDESLSEILISTSKEFRKQQEDALKDAQGSK